MAREITMQRREFVAALGAVAAAAQAQTRNGAGHNTGRLKQCAMRANFDPKMPFDGMCREAARLGIHGFDLIGPQDWPTLRKYSLIPTMVRPAASTSRTGCSTRNCTISWKNPWVKRWISAPAPAAQT